MSGERGYTQPTGDAFRWPDVLDQWEHWEHADPARKLPALLAPDARFRIGSAATYFDADLRQAIYAVVSGIDIDRRTVEEDWLIANTVDAAVAEQARRGPIICVERLREPERRQSLSPYTGKCDKRFEMADVTATLHGLFRRNVV